MNILGTGIDIIEIERIKKAINKNNKFLERIYTEKEIEYFKQKDYKAQTIAGNFAAKEAISKAFGTGIRGYNFKDIEILRNSLGKPVVTLYNKLYELSEKLEMKEILLSISHSKEYAVANAIITTRKEV
ncbi:holo-ACP synthase [Tepidibacter aestuarii]|uniref:holo-ACP synthase n=1 Tax=Tepidibacter aestuarii TaxID=2925782 RepID=UPI0020BE6F1E|nr:holo-ACP synthase [Tepidibacter aestuarii]CAH2215000.1 holo-acyl carrier protein synthase (phosphopantetheinyl transferase) [Tepidibacter aestuarii]